ncbi:hypothetical protein RJ639_002589 [Escallonia herrerae]|uniref:Reverse transcriptase Ty1/copia-type domain-containing protein n=1 Tax=Escallonia herrerae TaxID=1293975 RepID=A0AA89BT98_9ASTE|nr:hypothetical protein RJ639_002589 [Escallonia herrerae]
MPFVTREEKQCLVTANHAPTTNTAALMIKGDESQPRMSDNGDQNQFLPCTHYGKMNHNADHCYKVIGYPLNWHKHGKRSDRQNWLQEDLKDGTSSNSSLASTGAAFAIAMDGGDSAILGLTQVQHQQLLALVDGHAAMTGNPSTNMDSSSFLGSFVVALIYVDDVIITRTHSARISTLKHYLDAKFHIKDHGKLKYFLGIEVSPSPARIALSQRKYALDILAENGLARCKPAPLPMEQ